MSRDQVEREITIKQSRRVSMDFDIRNLITVSFQTDDKYYFLFKI